MHTLSIIDAFTGEPFKGNAAAVCLPAHEVSDEWMQQVASEMNLSETAFLIRESDGYRLRWFTPAVEVDLCGHATLAAAHYLFSKKIETGEIINFHTRSGLLTARRSTDRMIELDFPAIESIESSLDADILAALGATPLTVHRGKFDYIVEVATEAEVRRLSPDFLRLEIDGYRGIIVTAKADTASEYEVVSRCFFPAVGINEDPVTGSAHCMLAPFWARRLDCDRLRAHQASKRGGSIEMELIADRVKLRGHSVTVLEGMLSI